MRIRTGWIGFRRRPTDEYLHLLEFESVWLTAKLREQEQEHSEILLNLLRQVEGLHEKVAKIKELPDGP